MIEILGEYENSEVQAEIIIKNYRYIPEKGVKITDWEPGKVYIRGNGVEQLLTDEEDKRNIIEAIADWRMIENNFLRTL